MLVCCVLPCPLLSQSWLSWLSPRGRSSSRCEAGGSSCENLLVCSLTGGEVARHGQCSGLMSVCCLHPRPGRELRRVPRQLSLSGPRPRQARLASFTSPESPRFSSHQNQIVRKLSKSKYRRPRLGAVRGELDNFVVTGEDGEDGEDWTGCGLSRPVAQSRILGGTDAGYGQFPWTALIQIYSKDHGLDKMCAGSLIQDR